jgi:hypothetical protein
MNYFGAGARESSCEQRFNERREHYTVMSGILAIFAPLA